MQKHPKSTQKNLGQNERLLLAQTCVFFVSGLLHLFFWVSFVQKFNKGPKNFLQVWLKSSWTALSTLRQNFWYLVPSKVSKLSFKKTGPEKQALHCGGITCLVRDLLVFLFWLLPLTGKRFRYLNLTLSITKAVRS